MLCWLWLRRCSFLVGPGCPEHISRLEFALLCSCDLDQDTTDDLRCCTSKPQLGVCPASFQQTDFLLNTKNYISSTCSRLIIFFSCARGCKASVPTEMSPDLNLSVGTMLVFPGVEAGFLLISISDPPRFLERGRVSSFLFLPDFPKGSEPKLNLLPGSMNSLMSFAFLRCGHKLRI